jgi:hypothetical protein
MTYDHSTTTDRAATLMDRVIEVLSERHTGRANAIKVPDLAEQLGERDREVREAARQARRDGVLLLSATSPPYGYFIAETEEEWIEFRDRNLVPRATDILETSRAMGKAAAKRFGNDDKPQVFQLTIFGMPELVA